MVFTINTSSKLVDISELMWNEEVNSELKKDIVGLDSGNVIPLPSKKMKPKFDLAEIPAEMKQHNCWVCWTKEERNGRTTKVPKNPKTCGNASTALSGTWGSFAQAKTYYTGHLDTIEGIGYVFTEGNGVVGIDIDHCIEDGHIIGKEIQELVDRCGSYVELSPSGTGLHMYVKGKWNGDGRKNNNLGGGMAIEVYPSKRFFTVTGYAYGDARPLVEDQHLLDEIYDRYFAAKEDSSDMVPAKLDDLDVAPEYVKRLQERLKNSRGWLALLWEGQHTKESDSEADMALLCRLLVICDGDEDAARKLFMASPYAQHKDADHREKLDREGYWRTSIDNAMDFLEQHPEFEQHDNLRPLLRYDGDNDGNASMLFEYMDGNVRYCKEQKAWLVYKDCWANDAVDQELKEKAVEMYRGLKATVKEIVKERYDDEDEIKKAEASLMKKIKSFGSTAGMNSVITYAQSYKDFVVSEKQLDTHDDLIAAGNGIINLRTGELLPFDRQLYITRRTPINYNPDAPAPKEFLKFMNAASCGIQDWVDYMQLVLGYCITGCTNQEAFFVFHGETGKNGKSTLIKLLCDMFPEHVTTMNKVALSESKSNSELNSPLSQVKNYRMVITNENNGKRRLDEEIVRGIASGESPNVRDLFEKSKREKFVPYKLVFIGNYVPKFNWRLYANLRRLCLIPFNNTIPNGKEDIHLREKLHKEKEGHLAWIVKGAMRSFKERLKNMPPVIEDYTRKLMFVEDPIYGFTQDEVIVTDDSEDTIQAEPFFEAYNDWRELHDLPRLSYKDAISGFGQRLKQLGYQKRFNSKKQVIYFGIKLRQKEESDNETEEDNEQKAEPDTPDSQENS